MFFENRLEEIKKQNLNFEQSVIIFAHFVLKAFNIDLRSLHKEHNVIANVLIKEGRERCNRLT